MCGALLGIEKLSIRLCAYSREVDQPGEVTCILRIVRVEPLRDINGVRVVLGEDNRLPETIAAGHLLAARHQVGENFVHGILVEEPFVDCFRFDAIGDFSVFAPLFRIPLLFLFFREVFVFNSFTLELQRHRHRLHGNQKPVVDRVFQRIGIGRHAILQLEERIGVVIDFVLRCRG